MPFTTACSHASKKDLAIKKYKVCVVSCSFQIYSYVGLIGTRSPNANWSIALNYLCKMHWHVFLSFPSFSFLLFVVSPSEMCRKAAFLQCASKIDGKKENNRWLDEM